MTTRSQSPTQEEWRREVELALGPDRSFERALVTRTLEGIDVEPLHSGSPGAPATDAGEVTPRGGGWAVAQRVDHPSPEVSNRQLLEDLAGGSTGLSIELDPGTAGPPGYGGPRGVRVRWLHDLDQLLAGVYLDAVPIAFGTSANGLPLAATFGALCEERAVDLGAVEAHLGMDAVATLAARGALPGDLEDARKEASALARGVAERMPRSRALAVDASPWSRAGGHAVQELGYALAAYAETLRALVEDGLSVEDADRQFVWRMDVGHDLITEVSKLRALRLLHAKALGAWSVESAPPLVLHATTSPRGLARRDPWTNMLRTTLGAFAAAVGGADLITTLPFDTALGEPGALGRRNARNLQLVLAREARLDHVGDPARGAHAFEARTDALARRAWALMQETEKTGGLAAALTSGRVATALSASRHDLSFQIHTRRRPLVGVSVFPPTDEAPTAPGSAEDPGAPARAARLAARGDVVLGPIDGLDHGIRAAAAGATLEELGDGLVRGAPLTADPLPSIREAAAFEDLAEGPALPAFLACLGALAAHSPRSQFAGDLLRAGGFDVVASTPGLDAEGLVAEFVASGARVACLCAADADLEEGAAAACEALRAAGAAAVVLARQPSDADGLLLAAGLHGHLHAGGNAVALLGELREAAAASPTPEAAG